MIIWHGMGLSNAWKKKRFFFLAANSSMLVITVWFLETPTQLQIINLLLRANRRKGLQFVVKLDFSCITYSVNYLIWIQLNEDAFLGNCKATYYTFLKEDLAIRLMNWGRLMFEDLLGENTLDWLSPIQISYFGKNYFSTDHCHFFGVSWQNRHIKGKKILENPT